MRTYQRDAVIYATCVNMGTMIPAYNMLQHMQFLRIKMPVHTTSISAMVFEIKEE